MGIDVFVLKMLVEDRVKRGPFGDTLQFGRQGVHIPAEVVGVADAIVRESGLADTLHALTGGSAWADEGLLHRLGADIVMAADASDFEGAQLVHDFNDPIGYEWHQRFDTVLDGGTLEHIFNLPTALANLMSVLRVGGRLISINAANNWLGHGFYQFSPDLAYRVFSAENGFELLDVHLVDLHATPELRDAQDGALVQRRLEIGHTRSPLYLMLCARKLVHTRPFSRWPQQSDYASAWTQHSRP